MGPGVAAVQSDGAARHRSPPAPYGCEPGGSEAGNDDGGGEVDDAEDRDVTVTRQQQRPAHRNAVPGSDQETVLQPDAVGEVVGASLAVTRPLIIAVSSTANGVIISFRRFVGSSMMTATGTSTGSATRAISR